MLRASTGADDASSGLEMTTGRPDATTAWTNTAAGRACKPTGEATVTLTAVTRDQLLTATR